MTLGDLTHSTVKQYMRVDYDDDDELIEIIIEAVQNYVLSYTGLTAEQAESYPELSLAALALCTEMYDERRMTVEGSRKANAVAESILDLHRRNLI